MKKILLIIFLASVMVFWVRPDTVIVIGRGVVGGGPTSFSDTFGSGSALDGDWTVVSGAFSVAGGSVSFDTGSYNRMAAVHSGTDCNSLTQYAGAQFTSNAGGSGKYPEFLLRYTDASSGHYSIQIGVNEDTCQLYYYPNGTGSGTQIGTDKALTGVDDNDKIFVTIEGTGTGTIWRVWLNPTANSPVSASEFDSGDSTPDASWTDDPPTPVNTGEIVGIGGYHISAGEIKMGDFWGGGL